MNHEPLLQPPDLTPKVFCIGFNKTGTSSVAKALREAGYLPFAAPRDLDDTPFYPAVFSGNFKPLVEAARHFRAFKDRPWNMCGAFRALDAAFPGSQFILTVRDEEAWWRSVHRWVTVEKPYMLTVYMAHLGASRFTRQAFIDGYRRHNEEIRAHFLARPNFLEMDLGAGHGWLELCGFLGIPKSDGPFHHINQQNYTDPTSRLAAPRVHRMSTSGI